MDLMAKLSVWLGLIDWKNFLKTIMEVMLFLVVPSIRASSIFRQLLSKSLRKIVS